MERFRQASCETNDSSFVNEVMDEEWLRLSEENQGLSPWRPTRSSCTPFKGIELDCSEDTSLDEVLSLLDEIQKELMDEERNILAQYEENLKFEESSLCAAIESLGTEDSVLCPVCKRNPLHQNKQVVFCACGIRIDTEHDALNLTYLRNQIDGALTIHGEQGCTMEPEFCVSVLQEVAVSNLVALCKACDFLFIVL